MSMLSVSLVALSLAPAAALLASDVASLKASLRQRSTDVERGFSADRAAKQALAANVEALEALNEDEAPTKSGKLLGDWALDYTDAADVLSLKL
eukprot:1151914-Prymnesium_polylepis.1